MIYRDIAIIGAGPAGLMAAERLAAAGQSVHVFDAMPSAGRKFLLAGKGGLNLTHAEAFEAFAGRYGPAQAWLQPLLQRFGAEQLRAWALGLGVDTFVGTSGRVFPQDMKAAPLLRAWLQRLRSLGVQLHALMQLFVRDFLRNRKFRWNSLLHKKPCRAGSYCGCITDSSILRKTKT